jgi:excisionase family DNA binding protein
MQTPSIGIPEGAALVTPPQTRTYLQVSMTTLRKLARDGALRPIGIGRALRYRRADIEAYVARLAAASV